MKVEVYKKLTNFTRSEPSSVIDILELNKAKQQALSFVKRGYFCSLVRDSNGNTLYKYVYSRSNKNGYILNISMKRWLSSLSMIAHTALSEYMQLSKPVFKNLKLESGCYGFWVCSVIGTHEQSVELDDECIHAIAVLICFIKDLGYKGIESIEFPTDYTEYTDAWACEDGNNGCVRIILS